MPASRRPLPVQHHRCPRNLAVRDDSTWEVLPAEFTGALVSRGSVTQQSYEREYFRVSELISQELAKDQS